jgi:hypothetical protein
MTDFQRFTSYPFMERGYREAQRTTGPRSSA